MPIYEYVCTECGEQRDVFMDIHSDHQPDNCWELNEETGKRCWGVLKRKDFYAPGLVKMKGMGGYPSRRRQITGSAPNTTDKGAMPERV